MHCTSDGCNETATFHLAYVTERKCSREEHLCENHARVTLTSGVAPRGGSLRTPSVLRGAKHFDLDMIVISELHDQQVIYLREVGGEQRIPILTGIFEATSLDRKVKGYPSPRPLTYDAMAMIIRALDAEVQDVLIDVLEQGAYHAKLRIRQGSRLLHVDIRPSDAFLLAIAFDRPIFFADDVLRLAADQAAEGPSLAPASAAPAKATADQMEAGPLYRHFTDRARKVMQLANQEAQRFNHEYIGTEHILLGLVKEGSGVAANVLKNLDVDLYRIRLEVERLVQKGPAMVTMGRLPQTPRAKKVIEYSMEEARSLNHNYVGSEHILLGLLREQEGVAAQVLMNLGLTLPKARNEILSLLRQPEHKDGGRDDSRLRGFPLGWPFLLAVLTAGMAGIAWLLVTRLR